MAKISVLDMAGKQVSDIELDDAIFGIEPNVHIMHAAVVNYLANQRQGTQSTLTRTEVRGGGRKPWKQKGTGHARQGSIRAPQWRHGGIALGPKPRDYTYSINKKEKRLALKSALSAKVAEGNLVVLDNLALEAIKTKTMATMFAVLGADKKPMVVTADKDSNVVLSTRNIEGANPATVSTINVYDILNCNKLIVTKDAIAKIEEVYR